MARKLIEIGSFFLFAAIVFLLVSSAIGMQLGTPFIDSPRNKNVPLHCEWSASGYDLVQAYWLNGSVAYRNFTNPDYNEIFLGSTHFFRGELWTCYVNATNSTANFTSNYTVLIDNAWPVFQNTSDVSFTEDILKNICINATDADGDQLTYSYSSDITLTSFNTATGCLSWMPLNANIGSHIMTYSVSDNYGASDPDNATANYTVIAVNDMPYTTPYINPMSKYQNQTLSQNYVGHDEETSDAGPFNFSVFSTYVDDLEYTYQEFTIVNISTTQGRLQYSRPEAYLRRPGNYTINLTVCERATFGCNSTLFNFSILSNNFNPYFLNWSSGTWQQNQNFTFYINATDYNTEDYLTFSVAVTPNTGCNYSDPWAGRINRTNSGFQNATGVINFTSPGMLNNSHVDCNRVTFTLSDGRGGIVYQNITLSITNANDAPILHQNSFYSINSIPSLNYNISNLTVPFNISTLYKLNSTDEDLFIESANEILGYSSNASSCVTCPLFSITSVGIINFTLTDSSYINHTYSYLVNVTDTSGISSSAIMEIYVRNNTLPYFINDLQNMTIAENEIFELIVNASDNEIPEGDSVFYNDTFPYALINSLGNLSFASNCSMVDIYNVEILLTDSFGGSVSQDFRLNITFSPDTPVVTSNFSINAVEGILSSVQLYPQYVYDEDMDPACQNQTDTLAYQYDIPAELLSSGISTDNSIFTITPDYNIEGIYVVNFTVNDSYGSSTTGHFNITVLNQTQAPIMYNVTAANSSNLLQWRNTSDFPGNITNVVILESEGNVTFNHTTIDPDGNELYYTWYLNGTNVSNNITYVYEFNYNSSGSFNLTLIVADIVEGYYLHNISFVWNISIDNVNRAPYMTRNFSNISAGAYYNRTSYFTSGDSHFVDPDGDELNFSINTSKSNTNHSSVVINGSDLVIYGATEGEDYVVFVASDGILTAESNNITISLVSIPVSVPQIETETETRTRTTTVVQTIIQEVEKENPILLDLIVPQPVTVYLNNTIRAPLTLQNNGNLTLRGIRLGAQTNNTLIDLAFSDTFFPQLEPGNKVTTDLIITSYKTFSNYEIFIYANVTDPDYSDSAIVYVNSLERSEGNDSLANTKITFAKDLLSSNPECIELNEFLRRAQSALDIKDYSEADRMLEAVIQGCKYLVSQSKLNKEKPSDFSLSALLEKFPIWIPLAILGAIVLIILLTTLSFGTHHKKHK